MAAEKTPDRINREQVGSLTMTIADYYAGSTNLDNGDYWTSGIQGIVGYWGCNSDNPTTTGTGEGIDITLTDASTGKLTFNLGEDNIQSIICILSKS